MLLFNFSFYLSNHIDHVIYDFLNNNILLFNKTRKHVKKYLKAIKIIYSNLLYSKMLEKPLSMSLSCSFYNKKPIKYRIVSTIVKAFLKLGVISIKKGFKNNFKRKMSEISLISNFLNIDEKYIRTANKTIIIKNDQKNIIKKESDKEMTYVNKSINSHKIEYNNKIIKPILLYRVFNKSSKDFGGRLFGGFWQTMSKKERLNIKIDDDNIVEYDYSNMHITMLYHINNIDYEVTDAYYISTYPRKVVKKSLNIILNSKSYGKAKKAIEYLITKEKMPRYDVNNIISTIIEKHKAISQYFFDPMIGMKLQKIESEISIDIVKKASSCGFIVLPVFDSFLAPARFEKELFNLMRESYFYYTKKDILIVKKS